MPYVSPRRQCNCSIIMHFCFQEPRPLSQADLERVIATTIRTNVAASEYSILTSLSSAQSRQRESDDYEVHDAIDEVSNLIMSRILSIQSLSQDP